MYSSIYYLEGVMKLLKTSKEIGEVISDCLDKYNNVSFAVAWIKDNNIYQELLEHKDKIQFSTVGIDFAGTDINVLNDFKYSDNVKIYKGKYTFHPKIYVFYNITRYTAIIGSANLTNGGMFNNDECAVLLTKEDGVLLKDILKILEEYFDKAKIITSDIINEYSKEYQVIQDNSNSIVKRLEPIKHKINEAPYINLKWEEVSKSIRNFEDIKDHVKMLENIQEIFRNISTKRIKFESKELVEERNKIIGNFVRDNENNNIYRVFGGLFNAGKAKGIFVNKNGEYTETLKKIGEALETIDILTKDTFKKIIHKSIVRNFLNSILNIKGCNLTTATRLLTVKRPDLFICINNGSNNKDSNKFKGNSKIINDIFKISFNSSNKDTLIKNYIDLLGKIYNTDYFKYPLIQNDDISNYRVAFLDRYFQALKNKKR